MKNLPQNTAMLLSFVNTQLRDSSPSLDDFCKSYNVDMEELKERLESFDYTYDETLNRFV